jgi:hypothetical protein
MFELSPEAPEGGAARVGLVGAAPLAAGAEPFAAGGEPPLEPPQPASAITTSTLAAASVRVKRREVGLLRVRMLGVGVLMLVSFLGRALAGASAGAFMRPAHAGSARIGEEAGALVVVCPALHETSAVRLSF